MACLSVQGSKPTDGAEAIVDESPPRRNRPTRRKNSDQYALLDLLQRFLDVFVGVLDGARQLTAASPLAFFLLDVGPGTVQLDQRLPQVLEALVLLIPALGRFIFGLDLSLAQRPINLRDGDADV